MTCISNGLIMIHLNGQRIENIAEFRARFQYILHMIQGGEEWLLWAIKDAITPVINANGEDHLLRVVQRGLHADDYIRFNTFRASLNKILTMSDSDIEQLSVNYRNVCDSLTNLKVLLQRNKILSYAEINDATGFITSMSTDQDHLFKVLSFEDMLILAPFVQKQKIVNDAKIQGSTFALDIAATIPDFVNLCYFFQEALQYLPSGTLTAPIQDKEVQAIYNQLLAVTPQWLFTPYTDADKNEKSLRQTVPELARANKFIGYYTTTSAALNLVRNISISDKSEKEMQSQIERHMSDIKNIVSYTPASEYNLSQDGKTATLQFETEEALIIVGIDNAGIIFLLPDTKMKKKQLNNSNL
jgi:hypothetical protein